MNTHGWKTYLAAVAAILTGIVALTNGDYVHGFQGILFGMGLIGIRGGRAKVIEAFQSCFPPDRQGPQ
ncbi:MAG TPA: hypothetical protein VE732_05295 [Nitrososphaera sp.]|nr:hypothetical protein [Nitrososphaera sp.]